DRRPDGQGPRSRYLAEVLGPAVEVLRVRRVRLAVRTTPAGEHTVRTDVDEARTGFAARLAEQVREEGVDVYGLPRVLRLFPLPDDPDAIEDPAWPSLHNRPPDRVELPCVHPLDDAGFIEHRGGTEPVIEAPEGDEHIFALGTKHLPCLVAQHTTTPEDEDAAHGGVALRSSANQRKYSTRPRRMSGSGTNPRSARSFRMSALQCSTSPCRDGAYSIVVRMPLVSCTNVASRLIVMLSPHPTL